MPAGDGASRSAPPGRLRGPAGDVEAEPGRAAAAGPALDGRRRHARPGVAHRDHGAAAGPGRDRHGNGVPSGRVREDVAEQRVDGGAEVGRRRPAPAAGRRAASTVDRAAAPRRPAPTRSAPGRATTATASQPAPSPSRTRPPRLGITSSTPRLTASTSSSSRSRSPGGQRLGVQPQGGQRRAQPVGQVGGGLALGGQQLADPAGQPVRPPRRPSRTSGGPAGVARAVEVAAAQPVGGRRQVGDRPGQRAGQPVGDQQGEQQQDDARARRAPARCGSPRRAAARPGRTPRRPPSRRPAATGCTSRVPSSASRPTAAGRRLVGAGVPGSPSHVAVGPADRHVRRSVGRADQGGRHLVPAGPGPPRGRGTGAAPGRRPAPGPRRPAATSDAAGSRKASSTIEVVAATSSVIWRSHELGLGQPRRPTPRTVCSSRGSAAVSPSLRRSHDRWTSTVLSDPP